MDVKSDTIKVLVSQYACRHSSDSKCTSYGQFVSDLANMEPSYRKKCFRSQGLKTAWLCTQTLQQMKTNLVVVAVVSEVLRVTGKIKPMQPQNNNIMLEGTTKVIQLRI